MNSQSDISLEPSYSVQNFVKSFIKDDTLFVKWERLHDLNVVKSMHSKMIDLVKKGKVKHVVNDLKDAKGAISSKAQDWMFSDFFLEVESLNERFEGFINIHPDSSLARMSLMTLTERVKTAGYNFKWEETSSLKEAIELV